MTIGAVATIALGGIAALALLYQAGKWALKRAGAAFLGWLFKGYWS